MTRPTRVLAAALSLMLGGAAMASEQPQSLIEAMQERAQQTVSPMALGQPGGNLVMNPVTPCRLLDTREASPRGGALMDQQSRAFFAFGQDFAATQGGAIGDCGIGDNLEVEAIVINLTIVAPAGDGFATAWPTGESLPLAATLTYAAGQTVTNEVIVPINANPATEDFQVYAYRQSHVVADVVGYLSRPQAAALECELGQQGQTSLPAGASYFIIFAPDCPVGYSAVSVMCDGGGAPVTVDGSAVVPGTGAACAYGNSGASPLAVFTAATCCRVPGR